MSVATYAIVGADAAVEAKLLYVSAVLIGIIGSTAGRFVVDLTCGVTPKLFIRGEWFVGTALLASVVYVVCDAGLGLSIWPASLISFTVAFLFRYTALLRHWEEPEPWHRLSCGPAGRSGPGSRTSFERNFTTTIDDLPDHLG